MKRSNYFAGMRTRVALVVCTAILGILALAPTAGAQSAGDQYIPNPDRAGVVDTGANQSVAADAGSANGGTLPFTGYPITPLVAIMAALLVGGLVLRFAVPALDRRRS